MLVDQDSRKGRRMSEKGIDAGEFDRRFDDGEDVSEYVEWAKAKRPGREQLIKELRDTQDRLRDEIQRIEKVLAQLEERDVPP